MPEHGWVAAEKGEKVREEGGVEGREERGQREGKEREKWEEERGEGEREGGKREEGGKGEEGEKGKEERETFSHVGNEVNNSGTGWDPLLSTHPHPSHLLVISCHGYTLH